MSKTDSTYNSEHEKAIQKAKKKIKGVYITGAYIGAINILIWLIAVIIGLPLGISLVLEAVIIFALTIGVDTFPICFYVSATFC